jgi:hypothetical protein
MANKQKAAIEAQLKAKSEEMSRKLNVVQDEAHSIGNSVSSISDSLKKAASSKAILATAGIVTIGAVAGYFLMRGKSSASEPALPDFVKRTSDPKSVQRAIENGTPVVLYQPHPPNRFEPIIAPLRQLFTSMSGQLVQLGTQVVMDLVQEKLHGLAKDAKDE